MPNFFDDILDAVGLSDSSVKEAVRRNKIWQKANPIVDEYDREITAMYNEEPEFMQSRYDEWQGIKNTIKQESSKDLKIVTDYAAAQSRKAAQERQQREQGLQQEYGDIQLPVPPMMNAQESTSVQQQLPPEAQPEEKPFTSAAARTILNNIERDKQANQPGGSIMQGEEINPSLRQFFRTTGQQGVVNALSGLSQVPGAIADVLPIAADYITDPQKAMMGLQNLSQTNPDPIQKIQNVLNDVSEQLTQAVESIPTDVSTGKEKGEYTQPISSFGELTDPTRIAAGVIQNLPLMLTFMGTMALNPATGIALIAGVEGGEASRAMDDWEDQTGEIINPKTRAMTTLAVGAINASLEKIGIESIFSALNVPIKGRFMQALLATGTEGSTEFAQEWTQILAEAGYRGSAETLHQRFYQELFKPENWIRSAESGVIGAATGFGLSYAGGRGGEQPFTPDEGTQIADQFQAGERRRLQREGRPQRKAEAAKERETEKQRAAVEKQASILEQEEKQNQIGQIQSVENRSQLTGLERDAIDLNINLYNSQGERRSDVYIRRKVKEAKAQLKKTRKNINPRLQNIKENDPLYKPIHMLSTQDKNEIGRQIIKLTEQGYDEQKLNALGLSGAQKLLRGDMELTNFRKMAEGQQQTYSFTEKPEVPGQEVAPKEKPVQGKFEPKNAIIKETRDFLKTSPDNKQRAEYFANKTDEELEQALSDVDKQLKELRPQIKGNPDAIQLYGDLSTTRDLINQSLMPYDPNIEKEIQIRPDIERIRNERTQPENVDTPANAEVQGHSKTGERERQVEEARVKTEPGGQGQQVIAPDDWRNHLIKARQYAIDLLGPEELTRLTDAKKLEWNNLESIVNTIDNYKKTEPGKSQAIDLAEKFKNSKYFEGKAVDGVANLVAQGQPFRTIANTINKHFKPADDEQIQEMIEIGVQVYARERLAEAKDDAEAFEIVKEIYNNQPILSRRTSTKKINQQYSTPLPLAWLMGKYINIENAQNVIDTTAGNGMLFIAKKNLDSTNAIEIDPRRSDNLKNIGIQNVNVRGNDITKIDDIYQSMSRVIINPPFGSIKMQKITGENNQTYQLTMLEHVIAAKSLEAMIDKGQAAILIGGNAYKNNFGSDKDELKNSERIFFNYLYSNYNVTDHINVPGKLYKRQGTEFPTQLILVNGRKISNNLAPTKEQITETNSWDDLYNILERRKTDVLRTEQRGESGGQPGVNRSGQQPSEQLSGLQGNAGGESGTVNISGTEGGQGQSSGTNERRVSGTTGTGTGTGTGGGRQSSENIEQPATGQNTIQPGSTTSGIPQAAPKRPSSSVLKPGYGEGNKLVSKSRAEELTKRLREKLNPKGNQGNTLADEQPSIDTELISIGMELAAFHIEAGNKSFEDFSRTMIGDLGEAVRPYLKSFYMAARSFPGMNTKGMNNEQEIERFIDMGKLDNITAEPEIIEQPQQQPTAPQETKPRTFEEGQVKSYISSKGPGMTTVMPNNVYDHVKNALEKITEEKGDVDEYVQKSLGYKTKQDLYKALGAEQIDDVAQAIYNIDKGNGIIIGDQAGIGKGRVAASILHYATTKGKKPIFFTYQSTLFSDLWRDFQNIGFADHKPLIINVHSAERASNITDENGNVIHQALTNDKRKRIFDQIEKNGLPPEYDMVFATYSQVNREGVKQQAILQRLGYKNIIVMDESHNATGKDSNTGEFFRNMLPAADGTVYLSATYAKRPDNLALYNNTILKEFSPEELEQVLDFGGVPLQEVVSGALAQAGQYTRHERSYDGISFSPVLMKDTIKTDTERAEAVTGILRQIVALDDILRQEVHRIDQSLRPQGRRATGQRTIRDHAAYAPFASRVHHIVGQMMLALKVDAAVSETMNEIKKGNKVVLTVFNTMESMLTDYVQDKDVKPGDYFDITFSDVLERALNKMLFYTHQSVGGERTKVPLELGETASNIVEGVRQNIKDLFSDLSASPLDLIRSRLENNGVRVGELTGRKYQVDFKNEDNPVLMAKEGEKQQIIRDFNGGSIDVVIANRSASTGLSLHASETFKDKSKRTMIVIQPDLDINQVVQMYGRINRTGQVVLPEYKLLFTGLPTEKRPAAVLTKKMKSLNANVSATQESATDFKTVDFMNEYGDAIAREMLLNMTPSEMQQTIGHAFDTDRVKALTARQVTGWLSLAPIKVQEEFLQSLKESYTTLIDDLNAKGENKLITQELDYQAETKDKNLVYKGSDNNNPLTSDAYLEDLEVNILKKPLSRKDVDTRVSGRKGEVDQRIGDILDRATKYYNSIESELNRQIGETNENKKRDALRSRKAEFQYEFESRKQDLLNLLEGVEIGENYNISEHDIVNESRKDTKVFNGVLVDIGTKNVGSPLAHSSILLKFATNDRARHYISVPMSKLIRDDKGFASIELERKGHGVPANWESTQSKTDRELVQAWTGNVFAAYLGNAGKNDSIIRFTTKDGTIREGIIIKDRDVDKNKVATSDVETVFKYLTAKAPSVLFAENDPYFKISFIDGYYYITVPQSKNAGEKYWANKQLNNIADQGRFFAKIFNNVEKQISINGFQAKIPRFKEAQLKEIVKSFELQFKLPFNYVTGTENQGGNPPRSGVFDARGYNDAHISTIDMPELVALVKNVMDGKTPRITEKMRKNSVNGMFHLGSESIFLNSEIFQNSNTAKKVLAHELGHVIDFLPDKTLKRGNILGRLANLKKYIQGEYDRLYRNSEIRAELKILTRLWKPFDPLANPKYTKYRYSSEELYADAISVLINDETLLQETAPQFYDALMRYMERKPDIEREYKLFKAHINRSQAEIEEDRLRLRRQGYDSGEQSYIETEEPLELTKKQLSEELYKKFVDENQGIIKRRNDALKSGRPIDPEDDPVYWVEELPYVSSQVFQYYRDIDNKIKKPMQNYGLNEQDIGDYLFLNRVLTERKHLANPWGYDPKVAESGLEYLKQKLGPNKFSQLEKLVETFKELRRRAVTDYVLSAEMYNEKLTETLDNAENYATFQVEHYLNQSYGQTATGHIYRQIGTFSGITNPFTATLLKDAKMIRSANRKFAAEATVNFMYQNYGDEIRKAERRWVNDHWEYLEPKDPKVGPIVYLSNGKLQGYYVPKSIADSFNADPYEASLVVRAYDTLYGWLKQVFVGKNPFWAFWNMQRDLRSTALKLPKASMIKMIKYAVKSLPDAMQDVFLNNSTPIVRELYEERALLVGRYWSAKVHSYETEFERILENYAINPQKYKNSVHKAFGLMMEGLELPGRFSERLFKIAGAKYLKDLGMTGKQAAHVVRTRAGSPDFYRRAQWTRTLNNLFMFSNAGKEGWRSTAEAVKDTPAEYTWKQVKYSILPKITMWGASLGLLGFMSGDDEEDEIKKMMNDITEHDKQNYFCVPISRTENGKVVYFVFPDDFSGQVMTGLMWRLLEQDRADYLTQLFDFASGEIPYSSLNPLIQLAFNAIQYASGKNPYDEWAGRYVIPDQEFKAGGKYAAEKYFKWQAEQMGLSVVYRFPNDQMKYVQSDLEKMLNSPVLGQALRRFVRVSDRGRAERYTDFIKDQERKQAAANIELREAMREPIDNTTEPSREHARELYGHLKDQGYDVGEFGRKFWPKYMVMALYKENDPVINAFIRANTKKEKEAVLQAANPGIQIDAAWVRRFKRELKQSFVD